MEQNPSGEANRFSASQAIYLILWNSKVHYRVYKRPYLSISWARSIIYFQQLVLFLPVNGLPLVLYQCLELIVTEPYFQKVKSTKYLMQFTSDPFQHFPNPESSRWFLSLRLKAK